MDAQRRWDAGQPQGRLALLSDRCRDILGHQHADAQLRARASATGSARSLSDAVRSFAASAARPACTSRSMACTTASPRPGPPRGKRSRARRDKGTATAGDTCPICAAARRSRPAAGYVAGLGGIHDQLRDIGVGSPLLKHHLDRRAAHAPPHRFRQAGIDGLADQVMPEPETVPLLGQKPRGDRLRLRFADPVAAGPARPAHRGRSCARAPKPSPRRPWQARSAARAGRPLSRRAGAAGARPRTAWPCRRRRSRGSPCAARAAVRSAGTAGPPPG